MATPHHVRRVPCSYFRTYIPDTEYLVELYDSWRADGREVTLIESWPMRIQSSMNDVVYNCDVCGLDFAQWICRDEDFRLTPWPMWQAVLCLGCYQFIVYRNGAAPAEYVPVQQPNLMLLPPTKAARQQAHARPTGRAIRQVARHRLSAQKQREVNMSKEDICKVPEVP